MLGITQYIYVALIIHKCPLVTYSKVLFSY